MFPLQREQIPFNVSDNSLTIKVNIMVSLEAELPAQVTKHFLFYLTGIRNQF
jgi:hypothetical protein